LVWSGATRIGKKKSEAAEWMVTFWAIVSSEETMA
jgi:hypothetical protein